MLLKSHKAILIFFFAVSCSDKSYDTVKNPVKDQDEINLSSLVASQTGGALDLATFLESGESAVTIDVVDGARDYTAVTTPQFPEIQEEPSLLSNNSVSSFTFSDSPVLTANGSEEQENSKISLDELNKLIARKDQTIASLTRLNEELIVEIQRLRSTEHSFIQRSQPLISSSKPDNQLYKLQEEIALLKSSLLQKSQEIDGLRLQSDQFQTGIDSLKPRVNTSFYNGNTLRTSAQNYDEISIRPESYQNPSSNGMEKCSLEFDAVVTLLNGKSKEVFYTEFFLVSKGFPDILYDESIFLKDYPQVSSFEELWALSRKSPFVYPGIYKRIRNALLKEVEQGRGHRVRTDIDGFAEFKNVSLGTFYLLGTAPVGKDGAVWNVPVRLRLGANKTSLTLANANWRG